jgi:hypothetical protein
MRTLLPLLFLAACTTDDVGVIADSSLLVSNESDYTIIEIYLTEIDDPDWGPNLLRGDVLLPGEQLLLGVDCGFYDALLVDEEDVECEIRDLDLCLNDADWVIRNTTCDVFGAATTAPRTLAGTSTARLGGHGYQDFQ